MILNGVVQDIPIQAQRECDKQNGRGIGKKNQN